MQPCGGSEATEPAEPAAAAIHFPNGDYATGQLMDSHEAGILHWRSAAFAGELAFPADAVQSVEFKRVVDPRNAGPYFFELAGGDTISGKLMALDERNVVV